MAPRLGKELLDAGKRVLDAARNATKVADPKIRSEVPLLSKVVPITKIPDYTKAAKSPTRLGSIAANTMLQPSKFNAAAIRSLSTAAAKHTAPNPAPSKKRILFIGVGKMATPIVKGIREKYPNYEIVVCSPNALGKGLPSGIECYTEAEEVKGKFDFIIAAVKPQICEGTLPFYKKNVEDGRTVVISVMAGVTTDTVGKLIGAPTIRKMPNTAAAVGASTTGMFVGEGVSPQQAKEAADLFRAVGTVIEVKDEITINSITACSGSGPAYFCYLVETISDAAINAGYPALDEKKVFDIMYKTLLDIEDYKTVKKYADSHPYSKKVESLGKSEGTLEELIKTLLVDIKSLPNEVGTAMKGIEAVGRIEAAILIVTQAFIEAASNGEGKVQFSEKDANMLFLNTARGAAKNAIADINTEKSAADLRDEVTSPKGTTYAGLQVLMGDEKMTLLKLCKGTLEAARERADELGAASQKKSPDSAPQGPSSPAALNQHERDGGRQS